MFETILVVDDDPGVLSIVRECLLEVGYRVITAPNGLAALETLRLGTSPDLILLDVRMSVMGGYAFRERQLEDARFAQIPVVVMSGTENCAEAAVAMGASGALQKPMGIPELVSAVETALHSRTR